MSLFIYTVLIHHRSPERAANRHKLQRVIDELGLKLVEIIDQPSVTDCEPTFVNKAWIIGRYLLKCTTDSWFQWRSGRDTWRQSLRRLIAESSKCILKYCFASSESWTRAYRACLIEVILVNKQFSSWEAALESQAKWMFLLEDDAQVIPTTVDRLRRLMELDLASLDGNVCAYYDLAGGYDPLALLPKNASWNPDNESWTLCHVRTNTTCSYLVSRSLLSTWLPIVRRYPLLRQLPVDHLINVVSMLTRQRTRSYVCLHWRVPFFQHGSFCESFGSTILGDR